MQSAWRWSFIGALCGVLIIMLMPSGSGGLLPGLDKLLHGVTFMLLFLIGAKAFPLPGCRNILFFGLLGYGVAIELMQGLTGYRSMEILDAVADLVGLFVGLFWSRKKGLANDCCG